MISFDTNIAVHAANSASPDHAAAVSFLHSLGPRTDVVICELVLVELYLKLRNEKIFARPLSAEQAAKVCQAYRSNGAWKLVNSAPIMGDVWREAAKKQFPFRRIIDLRLGLTLRHYGVTDFATANLKDFQGLGFTRVWNPL